MAKIINFFNHKGGVGKTTLVHNLAFLMADRGKKILVIDADPQMNLTSAFYGLSTSIEYSTDTNSKWQKLTKQYIAFDEYLDHHLKQVDCSKIMFTAEHRDNTDTGRIDFISGSINLPSIEAELYGLIKGRYEYTRRIPYQFEQAIRQQPNYDFVLIDTSPSASSIINALIMLSSDYCVAPVSPSFFSLQAIDNFSAIFRTWFDLLKDYQSTIGFSGLNFQRIKFLGLVVQMAKRYKGRKQEGTKATENWIRDMNTSIKKFETYALAHRLIISEADFKKIFPKSTAFVIEKCCDFTPNLQTLAELAGKPVAYLTDEICKNIFKNRPDLSAQHSHLKRISIEKNGQYSLTMQSIQKSYQKIADDLIKLPDFKSEID